MKVGNLVKRSNQFKEWMKHNSWMTQDENNEIGLIVAIENQGKDIKVLWSFTGLSYDEPNELELLSESW